MQHRRTLLKTSAFALAGIAVTSPFSRTFAEEGTATPGGSEARWADLLGWKIGCQTYSFRLFPFEEAVRKNVQCGCRYLEAYPGQKLTAKGGKVGPGMNKEERRLFQTILADYGCVCSCFGVAEAKKETFEFCAEMGIEILNSEPPFDQLPQVDRWCEEFNIRVGLHNHPKPTRYWDYNVYLPLLKDLSPRVGACVDIGHFLRSELDPMEAIKALNGRITSFHFKDLDATGKEAKDVVWGTGKANVPALMKELAEQRFRGPFSAEFERNWENSVPEITESVKFFNATAKEIVLEKV